jgi:hypothetical protein
VALARVTGSIVDPIKTLPTECAAWRPSRIAHTTNEGRAAYRRRRTPSGWSFDRRRVGLGVAARITLPGHKASSLSSKADSVCSH